MGSFQTLELIETFINYQESIKRCICIIYDPQRTKTGSLKVPPPLPGGPCPAPPRHPCCCEVQACPPDGRVSWGGPGHRTL